MSTITSFLGVILFMVLFLGVVCSEQWGPPLAARIVKFYRTIKTRIQNPRMVRGCCNSDRSVNMGNEKTVAALGALKSSGAFSGAQLAAIDTAIAVANGEKWVEGAVYERVAPPGVKTTGDKYVATSKLAKKAGDDRTFNMLNLSHRNGVPTREVYSAGKFRKIADCVADILA